jgi:hypothetical protein
MLAQGARARALGGELCDPVHGSQHRASLGGRRTGLRRPRVRLLHHPRRHPRRRARGDGGRILAAPAAPTAAFFTVSPRFSIGSPSCFFSAYLRWVASSSLSSNKLTLHVV